MPRHFDRTLIQFLFTMFVVVMVAVFNWIKNRSESKQEEDSNRGKDIPPPPRPRSRPMPVPGPAAPKPVARRIDWEEELRRLLQGETAAPPPIPPARPQTQSAPPPVPAVPRPGPRPVPRQITVEDVRGLPVQLPGLTTSAQAYLHASQLDESVAERLRQIGQRIEQRAPLRRAQVTPPQTLPVMSLVGNSRSLRAVILASAILGPPKGLEV